MTFRSSGQRDVTSCSVDGVGALDAEEVRGAVLRDGAVLLRGLDVRDAAALAGVRDALGGAPAGLAEEFAPREHLGHGVYSAPEWAADREMCLHHDRSYGTDFPGLLIMACLRVPDSGGATLLADTRAVLADLPPDLVARFEREGWLLVRNFRPYFGLPWSVAHGAADPAGVERACADRGIGVRWLRDGALHTSQLRSAVLTHPVTGERCWFNQIAFFSQWSVDAEEREVLLSTFGPSGIPFNTAFGGGDALPVDDFQVLLDAYDRAVRRVEWQPGDVLVLDNLLTAHGREPHTGERLVAVAPADPLPLAHCAPTITPGPASPPPSTM